MDGNDGLSLSDIIEIHPMYLLRWEEAEQAHLLLYPEGIVKLNAPAAEILKRCVGGRSVADILADLQSVFVGEDIAADVHAFLEISNDKGWTRVKA